MNESAGFGLGRPRVEKSSRESGRRANELSTPKSSHVVFAIHGTSSGACCMQNAAKKVLCKLGTLNASFLFYDTFYFGRIRSINAKCKPAHM